MDHSQLLELVKEHPYVAVVTAAVAEGRITAIMVGGFSSQGYLNPFIAYAIFSVMSILGDTIFYLLGRFGNSQISKTRWQPKMDKVNGRLTKGLKTAIWIGKFSGIGSKPIILAAGIAKMPLLKFYGVIISCTLVMFAIYVGIGYFCAEWFF